MFVKTLTTSSSIFQATKLKTCTQQLKHEKYRNQANQEQLQLFFMMSPSDLSATPSSECLQERCSRHRHWETYDNKTNLKQLTEQHVDKIVSTASISVSRPPFKLKLGTCAQPYRPFWKQQVNLELTKSTILLLPHQTNSSAFGTLLRYEHQGYTRRYSCVPCIWIYPKGENAAVPVIGSWRAVGETHLIRPVTSSITWQGGDLMSFTSRARG